jgi:hypothetical protein
MLRGYRDYEGYPILFLYRHSLELYIKAIIYKGTNLLWLKNRTKYNRNCLWENHHLSDFLPILKKIFEATIDEWQGEPDGFRSFDDFARLVKGIEDVDPNSYCFRYPVNRKGKPAHEEHLLVNVIHFAKKMDPVLDMLDAAVTYIDETWQLSAEVEYFLQELFKRDKA